MSSYRFRMGIQNFCMPGERSESHVHVERRSLQRTWTPLLLHSADMPSMKPVVGPLELLGQVPTKSRVPKRRGSPPWIATARLRFWWYSVHMALEARIDAILDELPDVPVVIMNRGVPHVLKNRHLAALETRPYWAVAFQPCKYNQPTIAAAMATFITDVIGVPVSPAELHAWSSSPSILQKESRFEKKEVWRPSPQGRFPVYFDIFDKVKYFDVAEEAADTEAALARLRTQSDSSRAMWTLYHQKRSRAVAIHGGEPRRFGTLLFVGTCPKSSSGPTTGFIEGMSALCNRSGVHVRWRDLRSTCTCDSLRSPGMQKFCMPIRKRYDDMPLMHLRLQNAISEAKEAGAALVITNRAVCPLINATMTEILSTLPFWAVAFQPCRYSQPAVACVMSRFLTALSGTCISVEMLRDWGSVRSDLQKASRFPLKAQAASPSSSSLSSFFVSTDVGDEDDGQDGEPDSDSSSNQGSASSFGDNDSDEAMTDVR